MSAEPESAGVSRDVPVLWMDDEPDFLFDLNRLLREEDLGLSITPARSIAEAERELDTGAYCALVVDCQMDKLNPGEQSGAAFLVKANQVYPCLPTFVYSGYRHDALYREDLARANPVYEADRLAVTWQKPLARVAFISQILRYALDYQSVKDLSPENIRFADYLGDPPKYQRDVEGHWRKHRIWILRKLREHGYAWCVVCGTNLVEGSADMFEYPDDDKLIQIGTKYNLVPFAYSRSVLPESVDRPASEGVGWTKTGLSEDYYPTVRVRIEQQRILADFDTGAFQTHVSDELIKPGRFDFIRETEAMHLGGPYSFWTKKVALTLVSRDGDERTASVPVTVVRDWAQSPFVNLNDQRTAVVGRDILRAFHVEIALNSSSRESNVRFLE